MRQVLAIASREFVERKLVLGAGALLAVLILLAPLLPGVSAFKPWDVIGVASTYVSLLILVVGSLVMGMTSINGDLAAGRLGFYFSRPLSGISIWIGKVAGALAVVFATAALSFFPLVIGSVTGLGENYRSILAGDPKVIGFFAALIVGLFFFGHVAACMARVRSIWLLLDFAGLFGVAASLVALFDFYFRLLPLDAITLFLAESIPGVLMTAIGLSVVAGLSGVLVGRVDPGRVHKWTSIVLWGSVTVAVVAVWIFSGWVANARPSDIWHGERQLWTVPGSGDWVVAEGKARAGIEQKFVIRDEDHFLKVGSRVVLYASPELVVAIDPTPVFRFLPQNASLTGTIVVSDPDEPTGWKRTKIECSTRGRGDRRVAISRLGNRIAIHEERSLAVYSLPDERLLRSIPLEVQSTDSIAFVDDDTLRVARRTSRGELERVELTIFDLTTGQPSSSVSFETNGYLIDPTERYVLLRVGNERRILDMESGSVVGTFESRAYIGTVRWLSNGTLAVPDMVPGDGRVFRVMAKDGSELHRIEFPGATVLGLGFESRPGLLAATVGPSYDRHRCEERRLISIDLEESSYREIGPGLTPVWSWEHEAQVGSAAARTFSTCDGGLVRYGPDLMSQGTLLD